MFLNGLLKNLLTLKLDYCIYFYSQSPSASVGHSRGRGGLTITLLGKFQTAVAMKWDSCRVLAEVTLSDCDAQELVIGLLTIG